MYLNKTLLEKKNYKAAAANYEQQNIEFQK